MAPLAWLRRLFFRPKLKVYDEAALGLLQRARQEACSDRCIVMTVEHLRQALRREPPPGPTHVVTMSREVKDVLRAAERRAATRGGAQVQLDDIQGVMLR